MPLVCLGKPVKRWKAVPKVWRERCAILLPLAASRRAAPNRVGPAPDSASRAWQWPAGDRCTCGCPGRGSEETASQGSEVDPANVCSGMVHRSGEFPGGGLLSDGGGKFIQGNTFFLEVQHASESYHFVLLLRFSSSHC